MGIVAVLVKSLVICGAEENKLMLRGLRMVFPESRD